MKRQIRVKSPGVATAGASFAVCWQPLGLLSYNTLTERQAQHLASRFGLRISTARVLSRHVFGDGGAHE